MRYQSRFRVHATVEAVASFHSRSASMAAITPPPIFVQIHDAPAQLAEGDQMDFTLWMGPLPLHWVAQFEDVTPHGFVDRQVRGPMRLWRHRHSFIPVDERATDVLDDVELEIRPHPLWGPVGLGMALGLPVLFAYRAWRTRQLLEHASRTSKDVTPAGPGDRDPGRSLAPWAVAAVLLFAVAAVAIARRFSLRKS